MPNLIKNAAKHYARQQKIANFNFDGGFHTSGHCAVYFTLKDAVIAQADKFRSDTDNKIIVRDDIFIPQRLRFTDPCDMVLKCGILVAFFDVFCSPAFFALLQAVRCPAGRRFDTMPQD